MNKATVWDAAEPEAPSNDCRPAGIYEDVPFDEYCKWDAVNQSRLKLLGRSPEHYLMAEHSEPTKALEFGELCHVGVLETGRVFECYAVMPAYEDDAENLTAAGDKPKNPKSTGYYKDKKAQFEKRAAETGRKVVEESEFKMVFGMVEAIQRNTTASSYLNGRREVSIVWNDTSTGIRCKARIDVAAEDGLTDFKTCPDPHPQEFERSIWKYGYHRQAAWYIDGWEALTGDVLPFRIVAVGKETPRQCCAAEMDTLSVTIGRAENKEALAYLQECRQLQSWPGYENPVCWSLPAFVTDKFLEVGE